MQHGSEALQLADLDVEVTTPANTTYVGTAKAFSPGQRSLSLTPPVSPGQPPYTGDDFIIKGEELEVRFSLLIRDQTRLFRLRARATRSESDGLTVQFVDPDLAALVALQELVTRAENASARAAKGERGPPKSENAEVPLSSKPSHSDQTPSSPDNVVSLQASPSQRPKKTADFGADPSPDPSGVTSSDDDRSAEQPDLDDSHGDTVVGRNLANLIDELHEEHSELKAGRSREDGPDEAPAAQQLETDSGQSELDEQIQHIISSDAGELETDLHESAGERALAVRPQESPGVRTASAAPDDALSGITQTLEAELRRYAEENAATQRRRFEQRVNNTVAELKQLATERMRKNAEKIRSACHSAYARKEAKLQQRYERLMSLAEKVRRQKTEIREARKQLEAKLEAVDELHRQVSRIGETMSRQVDDLEDMVGHDEP
ncbi:MAG: hypothetical protein GWN84_09865 [Gammaproteobacteria bacterium]|nr:hypothetical protein [Gammaproteobacteria bacterium]NIR83169.1 hypothetical protein [Gammaproteobacteria bacterium]NIR90977.1 hypothetical protein [Gammaproteobacteria bacterium]NIU04334.1 hypothetical protein [Gammaproteobacteria bacterium]NIV52557.1 hypothetical protein [Gammaproteobacteria bacterium]